MQKCEVCLTPFTWNQVSKSIWLAYRPIVCRNCSERYKVQFLSRLWISILTIGPIFITTFFSPPTSTKGLILIVFMYLPVIFMLLPYLIRYRRY